jgi:hypothetical protein
MSETARRMRKPTLKEFLALECGEVLERVLFATYLEDLILEWAIGMGPSEGQLPGASGRAFAAWLNAGWADWTEEEDVPVHKILEGAVTEWCGGRSF